MLSCEAGQPQLLIGHVAFKFPITRGELGQVSLHCVEEVLHFLEGFLGTCSLREIGRKRDCARQRWRSLSPARSQGRPTAAPRFLLHPRGREPAPRSSCQQGHPHRPFQDRYPQTP
jgi:hypothetical protein